MKPISQRKKKVPSVKGMPVYVREATAQEIDEALMLPHELRKKVLSVLHGIPEKDIFVDPGNGVELYRTSTGGWAYAPGY